MFWIFRGHASYHGKHRLRLMLTSVAIDPPATEAPRRRYRTIFISDIHLGTRGCKADCLLARAREGTEVVYLPGNHDEALRKLIGRSVRGVKIRHDTIHSTADGRRLLVVHGDAFDGVVTEMRWLALAGSVAYEIALTANTWFNVARRWLGLGYWPLSAFLKEQVKAAVKFIDRYERSLAREARRRSVCGVICGHVHKPEMRIIDGVLYYNDGDWVESCSALVEHKDGRFELLAWAQRRRLDLLAPRRPAARGSAGRRPATT